MPPKPDQDPVSAPKAQNRNQSIPTIQIKESLIGHKLGGRYLIERELGRGGMGAVYLLL